MKDLVIEGVNITVIENKRDLSEFTLFEVQGNLWTDVHGNTYHSCYVSGLIGETYIDLGHCNYTYGYDNNYEQTGRIILENTVEGFKSDESALWRIAADLNIKIDSTKKVVKRKKDL